MAIIEHKLNFNSTSSPQTPAGWVDCGEGNSAGVKAANMNGSGIGYEVTTPFSSAALVSGSFESGVSHHGIPFDVWARVSSATTASGGSEAKFFGGTPGMPVEIDFFGCSPSAGRHRLLTVDGVTYQNDQPADVSTPLQPLAPTTAEAVFDENGEILMKFEAVTINASFAGLILRYDDEWSSGPKIVEVNADENIATYGEQCEMTVTGFTSSVLWATIAGISCTDVSDNGFTMPDLIDEASVQMFGNRQLTVGNDDESASLNIDVVAPEGFRAVVLGDDLNQTNTGTIFDFVPAAKEDDAIFAESPLVVDNKGNIIDAPAGVYNCWHLSVDDVDPKIAVARSFIVTLGGGPDPDDRPDDVKFNTVNNADLNTEYESNTVEITGINVTVDVTISGGEYRIDDGEWGSAAGTIQNGQEIQLRADSPADKNQTTVVTINVGSATFKWRIHTERDTGGVSQIPGMQVPTMRGLS